MSKMSRCLFLLAFLSLYPIFGCGNSTIPEAPANSFQVVVFSDRHCNPFYDTTLFPALIAADPIQWEAIFRTSSVTVPSAWGSDTNYPLLVLALSGIKQNAGASPVIPYTGDLLGHSFPQIYFTLCNCQDFAAVQAFTDKTLAFLAGQVRSPVGTVPVVFALGNIDSYIGDGADSTFLSHNAELFYTQFLVGSEDHQTFLNTFTSGGYYSAAPLGTKLLVIGLNTTPLPPLIPANKAPGNNNLAVDAQLVWLDATLAAAQTAGQKVWLLMHVLPGADTVTTVSTPADFNGSGQLVTPAMMWVANYRDNFLRILAKYPGLITLTLGAHTHMDEFRILSPEIVLDEVPAITPCFGENPAFEIFTLTRDTLTPIDYRALNYDLATLPARFSNYYTFSAATSAQGPLDASLAQLYPALVANSAEQALYRGHYNSGNGASLNVTTHANWNPIADANWPVFACGIGNMAQQDLLSCVNAF